MMHATMVLSALLAVAAAVPHQPPTPVIAARQSVVTPPPCEAMDPAPSAEETEQRFNEFADAFLVEQNITRAFEYISSTYIVSVVFAKYLFLVGVHMYLQARKKVTCVCTSI